MLGVVLFAVALFFAGMSTKLRGKGARTAMLVDRHASCSSAATWIATFPVSVSI